MPSLGDLFLTVGAKIDGFRSAMGEVKSTVNSTGSAFQKFGLLAGAGLGAIGVSALAAANKFNDAFTAIQNATGATGAKLDGLNKSFLNVYKQVDESSGQVSAALSLLATRTGQTGVNLENLTIKLLDLAKVQREDIGSLTPGITRAFGDWGVATDQQGRAMDYLGVVSQQTGTKVSRLADTIVYAGAPLRALGYDFEQSTALIAKFEAEGVNTELVLGGMKAALGKFAKEGKDAAVEWDKLVKGVQNGRISFQEVQTLVGTKRGADLFRAIVEGRFEIDKTVDSFRELAKEGVQTVDTVKEKFVKLQHQIEATLGAHKELVMGVGLLGPAAASMTGGLKDAVGGWPILLRGTGILAGVAFVSGFMQAMSEQYPSVAAALNVMFGGGFGKPGGKSHYSAEDLLRQGVRSVPNAAATAEAPGGPGAPGPIATPPPSSGAGGGGSSLKSHKPAEFVGPLESYFATPFYVEMIHQQTAEASKLVDVVVSLGAAGMETAGKLRGAWQEQGAGFKDLYLQTMNTLPVMAQIADVDMSKTRKGILETDDLMAQLGLTSTRALRAVYDNALKAAQGVAVLVANGQAAPSDLSAAMDKVATAHKDLSQRVNDWDDKTKKATKTGIDFGRQISTVYTDLGRSLADVVLGTKRWGDAFKDVGKSVVRLIMEDIIGIGFSALKSGLKDLTKHLGGLTSAFSSLLGGGVGGLTPAMTEAGSAIQSAAVNAATGGIGAATSASKSAAGAASQAAGMGLSGMMNMVTGGISAVSGVIGNFQFAGMNKSLDVLVNHTLRIFNEVFQMRKDHWDQFNGGFTRLGEIWNTLKERGAGNVTIDLRNSTFGAGVTKASMQEAFQAMYRDAVAATGR